MKALEKDRNRRYETASAFAADIDCYLKDEPVQACPPSARYRVGKFVRRNRGTLSAAALILITVIGGLAISSIMIARERDAAQAAAQEAQEQRAEALRQSELASAKAAEAERQRKSAVAYRMMTSGTIEQLLWGITNQLPRKERQAFVEKVLAFYQGQVKSDGADPQTRFALTHACRWAHGVLKALGNGEWRDQCERQATNMLEALVHEFPSEPDYQENLAEWYRELAGFRSDAGKDAEAIAWRRKALAQWEKLVTGFPTVPEYRRLLATSHVELATVLRSDPDEAQWHCGKSLGILASVPIDFPAASTDRDTQAEAYEGAGQVYSEAGHYQEAESALLEAVRLRAELAAELAGNAEAQDALQHARFSLGNLFYETGRPGEAEKYFRMTTLTAEKRVKEEPGGPGPRVRLIGQYFMLGNSLFAGGKEQEAEAIARKCVAIAEKLAAEDSRSLSYRKALSGSYYLLGLLLVATGREDEAADVLAKRIRLVEAKTAEFPDDPPVGPCWLLATCPVTRLRNPERALALAKILSQRYPGQYWLEVGAAEYGAGHWQPAIDALKNSKPNEALELFFLAMAHWQLGQKDEAWRRYDQAVEWMDKNRPRDLLILPVRREATKLLSVGPR